MPGRLRVLRLPRRSRAWWWWQATIAVTLLVGSAVFGVTTATARGAIGPHQARFDVTTDHTVTVDLGPLGTLQDDSPLPFTLGVRAVVQEIPQDVTGVGKVDTLGALQQDLDQYVGLFTGLSTTIRTVERALVLDAAWRTAGAFVVLLVAWLALRGLLGPARRAELVGRLRPHARALVAAVLVVLVGASVLTGSVAPRDRRPAAGATASAVFDGTPLQGARITGRLGGIVDTYSGLVLSTIRANDTFYDGARASLQAAWAQDEARRAAAPTPTAAGPGSAAAPSTTGGRTVTLLFVSDLHCNVGMARVIGAAARLSGASVVLDGGDTTLNGTSVEEQCVQTFARAVPKGVRLVAVPGNHDSRRTSAAYARAGATVLSGSVVTVDGIRFFGDADPDRTSFGESSSTRDETEGQAAARIADDVCADGDVDVLLIHNPRVAAPSLDRGCVPAALSGHLHVRTDPTQVGDGIRYISSTTGGAKAGRTTLGPLKNTAELTVLRWDTATRRFVSWQLVSIATDGTATVDDPQPWPAISPTGPTTPVPEPTGGD